MTPHTLSKVSSWDSNEVYQLIYTNSKKRPPLRAVFFFSLFSLQVWYLGRQRGKAGGGIKKKIQPLHTLLGRTWNLLPITRPPPTEILLPKNGNVEDWKNYKPHKSRKNSIEKEKNFFSKSFKDCIHSQVPQ